MSPSESDNPVLARKSGGRRNPSSEPSNDVQIMNANDDQQRILAAKQVVGIATKHANNAHASSSKQVPHSQVDPRQLLDNYRNASRTAVPLPRMQELRRKDISGLLFRKSAGAVSSQPHHGLMSSGAPTVRKQVMPVHMIPSSRNDNATLAKSGKSPVPLWQEQDEAREARLRSNKRTREEGGIVQESVKRISFGRSHQAQTKSAQRNRSASPEVARRRAYLNLGMRLVGDGTPRVSDVEMEMASNEVEHLRGPRRSIQRKMTPQRGLKSTAARKVDIIEASDSEEDEPDDDESETESTASSSSLHEINNQIDSELGQIPASKDEAGFIKQEATEFSLTRKSGSPEIIYLDTPPKITIPLPQIAPEYQQPIKIEHSEPPLQLISAIERLELAPVRMHQTRQLPFLLRNLRKGFLDRCRTLNIPTTFKGKEKEALRKILIRYEHIDNISHETIISDWRCPLCSLHSTFPTREVLVYHLEWDHAEVHVEWKRRENREETQWIIQLLIPEENVPIANQIDLRNAKGDTLDVLREPDSSHNEVEEPIPATPQNRRQSLFPFVTLSPLTPLPRTPTLTEVSESARHDTPPTSTTGSSVAPTESEAGFTLPPKFKWMKPAVRSDDANRFQSPRSSGQPSHAASPSVSGVRSTTVASSTTVTTTTVTTAAEQTSRDERQTRYPTPPPPDDPLGPAARPPYLPAKSEYGGPTVYYSCRPGGACLFDLLNTLPMEPFGVLDWSVLDREEEIYESDDVKDEYKIMHALWARWILLNRNKFIVNYHKGTILFVNEYWRMIHRAAGWDALRYWLILLLANRFLTGREVANILKHYESLTGMATWYD